MIPLRIPKVGEPILPWNDDFAIGHDGLDGEHRALVETINAIHAAECAAQGDGGLLDVLIRQSIKHFQHENRVLRTIGKRPLPDANRLAFIGLVTRAALEEHALGHGPTLGRLHSIIRSKSSLKPHISSDLRDWFIDHAVKYDGHLKPVFKALGGG